MSQISSLRHITVLLDEAVAALNVRPDGRYVDGTFGRGGHSRLLLQQLGPDGLLLGFDKDPLAIATGQELAAEDGRFVVVQRSFAELGEEVAQRGWNGTVSGVLLDLGVSSPQLDRPERGFSFTEGPLDMRMSRLNPTTAADFLASASRQEIARVLREYGDEKRAQSIARAIVDRRKTEPIRTTSQLRSLVHRCYKGVSHVGGIDSATRTFLAIRITVNRELECLQTGLERGWTLLEPGGRLIAISFHSGEHRIVKQFVRRRLGTCICPPGIPVCGCGARVEARSLVRGSIKPSGQEVLVNPRSRSAQLRAIERIEPDEE